MRVLVLGAYGLIGSHVARALVEAGHAVTGLGRARGIEAAQRRMPPQVAWLAADIAELDTPARWQALLQQCQAEAVVNCAGLLQDGAGDRVQAVQATALRALVQAAEQAGLQCFVQISAPRASTEADTLFMRSKGEADAALRASMLPWLVLRPGLVLAREAYGATALVRALAAMPWVLPVAMADAKVQTVAVDDVVHAVRSALAGQVPLRRDFDLVEPQAHTLAEVVQAFRGWLGMPPARTWRVPRPLAGAIALVANGLSWLGWRSPLRSTALKELEAGIVGNPAAWREVMPPGCRPLHDTLQHMPATLQERWFARAYLLKPLLVAGLAVFWLASGLVAWFQVDAAAGVLTQRGHAGGWARAAVMGGIAVDVALGLAVLVRPWVRPAALGMLATSLFYVASATVLTPDLWADPLGPLVKVLPALLAAAALLALADSR